MTNQQAPSATVDEKVKVEEPKGLHSCPDGKVWADYYCAINPSADNGTMIGWFCNAMMAMHDHLYQTGKIRSQQATVDVDALWEKYREYDGNIYYFVTEENFKKAISELSQKRYTREDMIRFGHLVNGGNYGTDKFINAKIDQFDSEGKRL
jgi:YHS domain-containing protein